MQWQWVILSHLAGRELMEATSAVKMAQDSDLSILPRMESCNYGFPDVRTQT